MFVYINDTATTEIYKYVHTLAQHDALPIFVVRGATSSAANLGARVSRVKRAFAMTKALKSGQLALTRAECQYFSLHPLNGKISFPSFGKPVVQMNERAITYCFASGGYACISDRKSTRLNSSH